MPDQSTTPSKWPKAFVGQEKRVMFMLLAASALSAAVTRWIAAPDQIAGDVKQSLLAFGCQQLALQPFMNRPSSAVSLSEARGLIETLQDCAKRAEPPAPSSPPSPAPSDGGAPSMPPAPPSTVPVRDAGVAPTSPVKGQKP